MSSRLDCTRCDGTGHVADEDHGSPLCPDCDGDGVVEAQYRVVPSSDWEARTMTTRAAKRLIQELEIAAAAGNVDRFDSLYGQLVNLINSLKIRGAT